MAGKKKGGKRKKHKGGLPKALIKKHHGNLKAAWRDPEAQKYKAGHKGKSKKKSGDKKGGAKSKSKKKKGGKSGSRSSTHRSTSRNTARNVRSVVMKTNRNTTKLAIVPIPAAARVARKSSKKKGGKKKGKGRSRAKESYMLENPLGGTELLVGGLTALAGFVIYDGIDRVLATHALTAGTPDANGNVTYTDTPPTTGSYTGLYNATAVLAPMNATRWIAGGVATVAFLGMGHMVKSGVGRSALQCFGFGVGVRWLGKGLVDIVAKLAGKYGTVQRLYDAELRAGAAVSGATGYPANLPTTGLGHAALAQAPGRRTGLSGCCGNCDQGLPCCAGTPPPPPPPPPPPNKSFGNPQGQQTQVTPPSATGTQGVPRNGFAGAPASGAVMLGRAPIRGFVRPIAVLQGRR